MSGIKRLRLLRGIDMTGRDLELLMSQVAQHVSGRPRVNVRLWEPVTSYAKAELSRSPTGTAEIRINPALSYPEIYKSLCHEIGHLVYDWPVIRPSAFHLSEPDSVDDSDQARAARRASPMETRADAFSEKLAAFGKTASYDIYIEGGLPPIVSWLKGLLTYPPPRV